MVAEDVVRKPGTCDFGRWNTESESKLNDCDLQETDHTVDQANDFCRSSLVATQNPPQTNM